MWAFVVFDTGVLPAALPGWVLKVFKHVFISPVGHFNFIAA
jgi:hypothetical protein